MSDLLTAVHEQQKRTEATFDRLKEYGVEVGSVWIHLDSPYAFRITKIERTVPTSPSTDLTQVSAFRYRLEQENVSLFDTDDIVNGIACVYRGEQFLDMIDECAFLRVND